MIIATEADPSAVFPGDTSLITVHAVDPDGDQLSFSWQATGGSVTPQGDHAVWTAPQTSGEFSVGVRVDDSRGATASVSISVSVQAPISPAPTPAPSPTGSRDSAIWPFDKLSPWNYPIGSGAIYERIKAGSGTQFCCGTVNTDNSSMAIWIARDSDPVRRIYVKNRNMTYFERKIPAAAVASQGGDGHMIVISPNHLTAFEMYQAVKRPDGDWEASNAAVDVDLRGMGINVFAQAGSIAIADGSSATAGIIRAGELRNGIRHALQFLTNPKMWNRNAPGGRPFVWPASSADGYWNAPEPGGYGSSGNLYLGSLVAIPPLVNINSLGLETPEALVLARALQDYGAYGVDSGSGLGRIVFRYDSAARLAGDIDNLIANWAPFQRDTDRIGRQLQVVVNSHNAGRQPAVPGGGGTPRAPLAPPFPSANLGIFDVIAVNHGSRRDLT